MSSSNPSLAAYLEMYLQYMHALAYAQTTIHYRKGSLTKFLAWCDERSIKQLPQLTQKVLQRYQRHLATATHNGDKILSVVSQRHRLTAIKMWCKFLMKEHHLQSNPASELELPRLGKPLPKQPLTSEEAEKVLAQPDITTDLGIRDRAILETLYSTGIRRLELINLTLSDVNYSSGIVAIRHGKGNKDRFIPIGDRALKWVDQYQQEIRPSYQTTRSPKNIFLDKLGQAIHKNRLSYHVNQYIRKAGITKEGSCHLFRHTLATLMLDNGADIRYVQQMLGHSHLSTTEIYTHVAIHKLKEIHTLTHPAKLEVDGAVLSEEDVLAMLEAEAGEEVE